MYSLVIVVVTIWLALEFPGLLEVEEDVVGMLDSLLEVLTPALNGLAPPNARAEDELEALLEDKLFDDETEEVEVELDIDVVVVELVVG